MSRISLSVFRGLLRGEGSQTTFAFFLGAMMFLSLAYGHFFSGLLRERETMVVREGCGNRGGGGGDGGKTNSQGSGSVGLLSM